MLVVLPAVVVYRPNVISVCSNMISHVGVRKQGAYRILTVSKLWVTVTAPHAAIPPAMNALESGALAEAVPVLLCYISTTHPVVVDMFSDG